MKQALHGEIAIQGNGFLLKVSHPVNTHAFPKSKICAKGEWVLIRCFMALVSFLLCFKFSVDSPTKTYITFEEATFSWPCLRESVDWR